MRMTRKVRTGIRRGGIAAVVAMAAAAAPLIAGPPAGADAGPLSLDGSEQVGSVPVGIVPIGDIPPEVLQALPDLMPSAPLGSIPLGSIPLGSIPLGSIPLGSIPLGSIPLGSIPLGSIPLGSIPLGSIGGWEAVLAGIPELDRPPLTITFGELLAYIEANPGSPLAAIPLRDVDLADTPLGSISLAALALGGLPLGSIPLDGQAATEAERMALWCDALAAVDLLCAPEGPILGSSTLLTLDILGAPLGSIPLGSIPLGSIPLGSIPLGSIPLGSIPLGSIPLGSIPLGSIPLGSIPLGSIPLGSIPLGSISLLVDCALVDCATATLADAQAAGALVPTTVTELVEALAAAGVEVTLADLDGGWPSEVTFGDLLLALVDPADYPWEDLPLADLGLQQYVESTDQNVQGVVLTATFGTDGPATFTDPTLTIELSGTHRFLLADPVDVTFDPPLGTPPPLPTVTGPRMRIDLGEVPAGTEVSVLVRVAWGIEEGVGSLVATLAAEGYETQHTTSLVSVSDEEDHFDGIPCCDFEDFKFTLEPDTLYFKTADGNDIDYAIVDAPPAGYRLSVHVGGLGGDAQVGLFRVTPSGPLAGEPNPLGIGGTPQTEQPRGGAADAGPLTGDPAADLGDDGAVLVAATDVDGLGRESLNVISTGDTTRYLVRVTGSTSDEGKPGYLIRARYVPIAAETTCPARTFPFAGGGTAGTLPPALPAGVTTVFLVNQERLGDSYGAAEQADTVAALASLAGRSDLGVIGAVVPVEGDPDVATAYAAWDANPCSVSGANEVVAAIGDLLEELVAASPGAADTLESVVLVGADDLLPMARVPDLTRVANEINYAGDLRADDGSATPLSAAAETRHLLTDDPYGDVDPIPWLDHHLYVPDRAVGRLVEHPSEIRAALARFETSGGMLDASTALTTGYDFLRDGADAVDAGLGRRLPAGQRTLLNPEPWDAATLDAALFPGLDGPPAPAIASVNAHYDHNRLLPGVPPPHGDDVLYRSDEAAAHGPASLLGRLLFTMGCHGGASVPDIYVGTTDPDRLDWAQLVAGSGGSYVGNTGFGYGDSLTVALSERLMALYAERLDGNTTIGRALADAKQVYLGELGAYSNYDEKAMMQIAFYGLPMYRIGPPAAPPLPAPPPAPVPAFDPGTGLSVASISLSPQFEEVSAPDGTTYVRAEGQEPQASADRPLLPKVALRYAGGDEPLRGALITGLSSSIEPGVANSVARPVVDDAANEPANRFDDVAFPSQLATVNHYRTSSGEEESLVLLAGRFVTDDDPATPNGTGSRELFDEIDLLATFSDDPDHRRPSIRSSVAEIDGDQVTISADVTDLDEVGDAGEVRRVLVLYRVAGGPWIPLDLEADPETFLWSATGAVPPGTTAVEWFVQAVDDAGNVATHTDRGRMLRRSTVAPSFDAGPPLVAELGDRLVRTVTVTDPDSTRFRATADWGNGPVPAEVRGDTVRFTGLATRPGPTTVALRVCDDGGACTTDELDVLVLESSDVTPPVVTGTPDRAPNAHGWYRAPVTVAWTAADPEPSSGPASQPAPTVVGTEGAAVLAVSDPSCDGAGNCAQGTLALAIDRTAPNATITTGLLAPLRLLGGRFAGTATDGLSGVDTVTVRYVPVLLGTPTQVAATLTCGTGRTSCTWSAPLPGTGIYQATATVTDRAGNVRTTPTVTLTIVLL